MTKLSSIFIVLPLWNKIIIWHICWVKEIPFFWRNAFQGTPLCRGTVNQAGQYTQLLFSFAFFFKLHSTHRGATAAFWRTFMMEKLTQAGEGGGCTPNHLSRHLPSRTKLQCTLQLSMQIYSHPISYLYQYMYSEQCVLNKLPTFTDESKIEKVSAAGGELSAGQLGSAQLPASRQLTLTCSCSCCSMLIYISCSYSTIYSIFSYLFLWGREEVHTLLWTLTRWSLYCSVVA